MDISVILCTVNRCEKLSNVLDSLVAQVLPESISWEVLIVDNNSSDRTREVVEDFCRHYPGRFRYCFEPRAGKAYALNAGINRTQSDVLAFLDDDVIIEPHWLWNLTANVLSGEWDGAGGVIAVEWPSSLPKWLSTSGTYARNPFPEFHDGVVAKKLTKPPFGTNMAFKREMFQKHGYFRTDLGPSPNRKIPRPGEDTEFGSRLIAAGQRLGYEPSAVVCHPLEVDRMSKSYYLDWWFDEGRAGMRIYGIRRGAKWHIAGIPLYLVRSLVLWSARWMVSIERRKRFYYKVVVWGKVGGIVECHRRWRDSSINA